MESEWRELESKKVEKMDVFCLQYERLPWESELFRKTMKKFIENFSKFKCLKMGMSRPFDNFYHIFIWKLVNILGGSTQLDFFKTRVSALFFKKKILLSKQETEKKLRTASLGTQKNSLFWMIFKLPSN